MWLERHNMFIIWPSQKKTANLWQPDWGATVFSKPWLNGGHRSGESQQMHPMRLK